MSHTVNELSNAAHILMGKKDFNGAVDLYMRAGRLSANETTYTNLAKATYLNGDYDDSYNFWLNTLGYCIIDYVKRLPKQTLHNLRNSAYQDELISSFFSKCIHIGNAYITAKADKGAEEAVVNMIIDKDPNLTVNDASKIFRHNLAVYRALLISKDVKNLPSSAGIKSCNFDFNGFYFNQGKLIAMKSMHWEDIIKMVEQ